MKKTFLIVAIVLIAFSSTAGAQDIGIGVEYVFDFSGSVLNGLAITGSPPVLPMVFGLNFSFGGGAFHFGITADWWLYQTTISGPFALYVGPGLFFGIGSVLSLGVRVPIALQFWVIPPLELFLEVAPSIGLTFGGGSTVAPRFGVAAAIGGRFWF